MLLFLPICTFLVILHGASGLISRKGCGCASFKDTFGEYCGSDGNEYTDSCMAHCNNAVRPQMISPHQNEIDPISSRQFCAMVPARAMGNWSVSAPTQKNSSQSAGKTSKRTRTSAMQTATKS